MKTSTKLIIGSVMIFLIYLSIQLATNNTGRATDEATVKFSIISNVTEEEAAPTPTPSTGRGGIIGGISIPGCKEKWECSDWDQCQSSEYQSRECIDFNKCKTIKNKPVEIQRCNYVTRPATCFDNLQNSGEEGIDCGGLCVPCPSCSDGIRNQDEIDVDCGGLCAPCIKKVEVEESPIILGLRDIFGRMDVFWPVWLLLSLLLLIFVYLYELFKETEERHHVKAHKQVILKS